MVIGITGLANSGKSTLANELGRLGFDVHNLADVIKQWLLDSKTASRDQLWGLSKMRSQQLKRVNLEKIWDVAAKSQKINDDAVTYIFTRMRLHHPVTARTLLQEIGTLGRQYNQDLWIPEILDNQVWGDVRYENEAQAIRDAGGVIVRTIRDAATKHKMAHESENQDVKADYIIQANYFLIKQGMASTLVQQIRQDRGLA